MRTLLIVFGSSVLGFLACQISVTPVPEATLQPPGDEVVFTDDFSEPSNDWLFDLDAGGTASFEQGGYRLQVKRANSDIIVHPGLGLADVRIEAAAKRLSGPDENDFGLVCRYQDQENYNFFLIGSDGYYAIGKMSAGEMQLIGMEEMRFSRIVNQGDSTNLLRADCIGNRFALYVNGTILATGLDSEFFSGDVGLIAGTFDEVGTDILFDNFTVIRP